MGIFSEQVFVFGMLSFINRGPASFGFLSSMRAGRKNSIIIVAIVAIIVTISVFGFINNYINF